MNIDMNNENLKGKKIYRALLFIFLGIVLLVAVYTSLRRTAARFSRDFMSPFLRTVTVTEDGVFYAAQLAKPKRQLAAEVHALQERNLILEAKIHTLQNLQAENKTLRALLKMPEFPGYTPVTAEISGRTSVQWRERFVINRGWADGIRVGNAVAAPDDSGNIVIAGRVIEVSGGTAVVATVFSGDCHLSVITESDNSAGGMKVLDENTLPVVSYLPISGIYRDYGKILTSGIAEDTPARIPVATIVPRGKDSPPAEIVDQLYAQVKVSPLIRIDAVRTVVVFTKNGDSGK